VITRAFNAACTVLARGLVGLIFGPVDRTFARTSRTH